MSEEASDAGPRAAARPEAPATAVILAAARRLFQDRRVLDLSMREIAAAAGVAPSLLAYHFETRPQLLAAACLSAGDEWRAALADLEQLIGGQADADRCAEAASAWMFALAAKKPELPRLWGDLLLAAGRIPEFAAVAGEWTAAWRAAWRAVSPSPAVAEFAAFELVFAPALAGAAERDLIMREALRRMLRRAKGQAVGEADAYWHTRLCLDRMDARAASERDPTVKERIVEAAADIISEDGTAAATHRAIATRAGASLSSMTYHFGSRPELVREGLLRVFERSMTSRPAQAAAPASRADFAQAQAIRSGRSTDGKAGERLAMVRAIAEVALEAVVDPSFRPVATELRRIRGLVTRTSLANGLGLIAIRGGDASDYAIWESGAALLRDVERKATPPVRETHAAGLDLIFTP